MTRMTVNGEAIQYRLDPETPLLFALRDASNLTGTKHGCYSGDCGSCTVIVDGRALLSCSIGRRHRSLNVSVQRLKDPAQKRRGCLQIIDYALVDG